MTGTFSRVTRRAGAVAAATMAAGAALTMTAPISSASVPAPVVASAARHADECRLGQTREVRNGPYTQVDVCRSIEWMDGTVHNQWTFDHWKR